MQQAARPRGDEMQVLDAEDKKFLSEKYGFTTPDFIRVIKKMRAGFSIMKAAKIVAKHKGG